MNLQYRIDLLADLGKNILSDEAGWKAVIDKAGYENGWFTPEFVQLSVSSIARQFLDRDKLLQWAAR